MTNQLVMVGAPVLGEPIEEGDLKEIKVILQENGIKRGNPADNGKRYNEKIVTLKVTEEEDKFLRQSARYLEDISVNPTSCPVQELDQWSRRFIQHWEQVDGVFAMAMKEAGLLPSNYEVTATMGFKLI